MAEVVLSIGNRQHRIACRDGSEEQFRRIATKLDARWAAAERASGGMNAERSMLYVALMLADALEEAEQRVGAPASPAPVAVPTEAVPNSDLERLAERLEAIAAALEKPGEGT